MGEESWYEEETKRRGAAPPFHKRFNIDIPLAKAQGQFTNRILNGLESAFPLLEDSNEEVDYSDFIGINSYVANKLGQRYDIYGFTEYADTNDFLQFLQALEALHEAFEQYHDDRPHILGRIIQSAISSSEVDLGIQWREGHFWPSGANLLDDELVDKSLGWLRNDPTYSNVLAPFEKGLSHYLEATKDSNKLSDTITDMYEALEALTKIVCENDKDLSANRESFVSRLRLSQHYAKMLKDYSGYANEYRHGVEQTKQRITPNRNEVEAFIYTTGLFIRLAIQQLAEE